MSENTAERTTRRKVREGLVVSDTDGRWPRRHAWIELADSTVVDPTPSYCRPGAPRRLYCGAFRWTRGDALKRCTVPGATYAFYLRLPGHGVGDPRWLAASWATSTISGSNSRRARI